MKFTDVYSVDMGGGKSSCVVLDNKSPTLTCTHYGEPAVMYQRENITKGKMMEYITSNFKADGSVGDGIAFAIVGDHENRPTDMTNIVVYERADSIGIESESRNDNG